MREASNATIFDRFPESEGLKQLKTWFDASRYKWTHVEGDTCAHMPCRKSAWDYLQGAAFANKELFKKRGTAGEGTYIYVSLSNLAKELLCNRPEQLGEVIDQVKTYHEEQITPGEIIFDAMNYDVTKAGIHKAFSDMALHTMEYRRTREGRCLASRTLTKMNAEQLANVFAIALPGVATTVLESSVNPGFYRVLVNEAKASAVLIEAKNLQIMYGGHSSESVSPDTRFPSALTASRKTKITFSRSLNSSDYTAEVIEDERTSTRCRTSVSSVFDSSSSDDTIPASIPPSPMPASSSHIVYPSYAPPPLGTVTSSTSRTQTAAYKPIDWSSFISAAREEYQSGRGGFQR